MAPDRPERMRILVVHNRYRSSSPGGEDRVVDQEHAALVGAGHEVQRFERSNDEIAGFSLARKAVVPAAVVWSRLSRRDLDAAIEAFRPDVVHVHNVFPLLSASVLRSCTRNRVPCVVTFHNYQQACVRGDMFRDGTICRACVGRTVPAAGVRHGCYHGSPVATLPLALSAVVHRRAWRSVPAAYLFLSEAQRRELEPLGFPAWRCFVKSNMVPQTPPRARPEDLIVFLGRLAELKGVRVLMRAWDRYAAAAPGPKFRLAIAGSGPLEPEVRAWAAARPSVEVLGLLDREECATVVRRATAVVVPSEWPEPFGLVVAEAMAAAVAPVATAHAALEELITDGVDGLLYPPGDDGALADVLLRLERSPELVAALGNHALATYRRRFTPTRVVTELEAAYRFAIDHPPWRVEEERSCSPADRDAVDTAATRTVAGLGRLSRAASWRVLHNRLVGPGARAASHAIAASPRWSPLRALAPLRSRLKGEITATRLAEIVDALDRGGVRYWLAGGWGVDALGGRQSRRHDDVDVVLDDFDRRAALACEVLAELGFRLVERHERPVDLMGDQWVLDDGAGCRIDLLNLDTAALAEAVSRTGAVPALFTEGRAGHRRVPCLAAAAQHVLHSGFAARAVHRHDVRLLLAGNARAGAERPR